MTHHRNGADGPVDNIPCPDGSDWYEHAACAHWKADQRAGVWYCELHDGYEAPMEYEPEMPWE